MAEPPPLPAGRASWGGGDAAGASWRLIYMRTLRSITNEREQGGTAAPLVTPLPGNAAPNLRPSHHRGSQRPPAQDPPATHRVASSMPSEAAWVIGGAGDGRRCLLVTVWRRMHERQLPNHCPITENPPLLPIVNITRATRVCQRKPPCLSRLLGWVRNWEGTDAETWKNPHVASTECWRNFAVTCEF